MRATVAAAMFWPVAALAWSGGLYLTAGIALAGIILGHVVSWKYRRRPSSKRTLALFLLATVAFFWMVADLTTAFAGGWLPQAQFGMVVQGITSFELRSRGNLYSTLVHSLLIMYVAADLTFSLWLLIFIIAFAVNVAIVFVVGYVEDERRVSLNRPALSSLLGLSRLWSGYAFLTLSGAVLLFFALPRGGASQVASPSVATIMLPTSVRSQTVTPLFPFVQLKAGVAGFGPSMDLAFRGRPSNEIVMYVRSSLESYWRGLAFDKYTGREWISTSTRARIFRGGAGDFEVSAQAREQDGAEYTQTYFIKQDQPDAVFTGYRVKRIRIAARQLSAAVGEDGVFQAERPLAAGSTYAVVSSMPQFTAEGLRLDRAIAPEGRYLESPELSGRVIELSRKIAAAEMSDYDKALALEKHLRDTYPYDLNLPPLRPGTEAVDSFLFDYKRGFCQQFATAMAVMARAVGLPSRVVTGYLPGEHSPVTASYTVRAKDAHSWVEIYFQNHGWVPFDPTPSVGRTPRAGSGGAWWGSHIRGIPVAAVGGVVGPAFGAVAGTLTGLLGLLAVPALVLLIISALGFLGSKLFGRGRVKRDKGWYVKDADRRSVVGVYHQMERLLSSKGLPARQTNITPQEYAEQLRNKMTEGVAGPVDGLTEVVNRAVYDPRPLPVNAAAEAKKHLSALKDRLSGRRLSLE